MRVGVRDACQKVRVVEKNKRCSFFRGGRTGDESEKKQPRLSSWARKCQSFCGVFAEENDALFTCATGGHRRRAVNTRKLRDVGDIYT